MIIFMILVSATEKNDTKPVNNHMRTAFLRYSSAHEAANFCRFGATMASITLLLLLYFIPNIMNDPACPSLTRSLASWFEPSPPFVLDASHTVAVQAYFFATNDDIILEQPSKILGVRSYFDIKLTIAYIFVNAIEGQNIVTWNSASYPASPMVFLTHVPHVRAM